MQIYSKLENIPKELTNGVIALGNFDGLHIGHRELIKNAILDSKELGVKFILITFSPNPNELFKKDFQYLHSQDERYQTLKELGVEHCLEFKFDEEFSKISAADFIISLNKALAPKLVITGYNFTFGHKKQGDRKLLEKCSRDFKFSYKPIEEIRFNNKTVSSTYIRNLLASGRIRNAAKLLSKLFSISGKVIDGTKYSIENFNFPTANIQLDKNLITPLEGLYFCKIDFGPEKFDGVVKIQKSQIFAHLLDFEGNLKNEEININFISLIRPNWKFLDNEQELNQVNRDKNIARFLSRNLDSVNPISS